MPIRSTISPGTNSNPDSKEFQWPSNSIVNQLYRNTTSGHLSVLIIILGWLITYQTPGGHYYRLGQADSDGQTTYNRIFF